MLTALRAIAAVEGIPPKKGRTRLQIPWPINSLLLPCLVLVMPSQTTAQRSASIIPNKAIVKAAGRTFLTNSKLIDINWNDGSPEGISPTCGISSPRTMTAAVDKISGITEGGTFLRNLTLENNLGSKIKQSTVKIVKIIAKKLACDKFLTISIKVCQTCSLDDMVRPRALLIWPIKIIAPIPAVNPETIGNGINLINWPSLIIPKNTWITPARKPATNRPSNPYLLTEAKIITVIAPVGPVIENLEPPSKDPRIPAITAVYNPIIGGTPEAMAKAIAKGKATTAVINPALRS